MDSNELLFAQNVFTLFLTSLFLLSVILSCSKAKANRRMLLPVLHTGWSVGDGDRNDTACFTNSAHPRAFISVLTSLTVQEQKWRGPLVDLD